MKPKAPPNIVTMITKEIATLKNMLRNIKKLKPVDTKNLKNPLEEPESQAISTESNPSTQKQPFHTIKIRTVDSQSNLFQSKITKNLIKKFPLQPLHLRPRKNMISSARWSSNSKLT